mgnify:CR=1 FL=1
MSLPKDCTSRVIGSEARKLVHGKFSSLRWEYREITGMDNGEDCILELIENEQWTNRKLEGQIKGTRNLKILKGGEYISFDMEIKTINYGLSCSNSFILFYVDVDKEIVYYLPLQKYFISNRELFDKLKKNKSKVTVHIPVKNVVSDEDSDLCKHAKKLYKNGSSCELEEVR